MPNATAPTSKKSAPRRRAPATRKEAGVSLKDPASLVKAYFRLRSSLLSTQEQLALSVVDRAPKSLKLPTVDRAQILKLPVRRAKANGS